MNLKHQRSHVDNIYLYTNDPFKSKYQLLIKRRENIGVANLKNSIRFFNYLQIIHSIYENLEQYNPTKKRKLLTTFEKVL